MIIQALIPLFTIYAILIAISTPVARYIGVTWKEWFTLILTILVLIIIAASTAYLAFIILN